MNRNQTKPLSSTIKCCVCGKEVDRKVIIRMYEFECCSGTCLDPLRIKRQQEENAREEARKANRLNNSVYHMGGGGHAF